MKNVYPNKLYIPIHNPLSDFKFQVETNFATASETKYFRLGEFWDTLITLFTLIRIHFSLQTGQLT